MTGISLVVIGMVCGLAPIIVGALREQLEMGIFGFVSCIISALAYSFYLAVPIALMFTFLFIRPKRVLPANIIPFPVKRQRL